MPENWSFDNCDHKIFDTIANMLNTNLVDIVQAGSRLLTVENRETAA